MKKILKFTFWILAWVLFPIATGLYFIWPGKICKNKMSKGWKIFWWILYAVIAFVYATIKILFCLMFIAFAYGDDGESTITESATPANYRTSEDFYKLTGVEFPELEIVDSLFFDEHFPPSNVWNEYRFVAKGGLKNDFYKRLKRACKTDFTHWSYSEGSISDYFYNGMGKPIIGDRKIYKYWIYPDSTPVDRSRGMCDRMVDIGEVKKVVDWDGHFISVEIHNDTIVLREGWVR